MLATLTSSELRTTQVYLFGSHAAHLPRLLTGEEERSMFRELAVGYLKRISADTERYQKLAPAEREAFWR